MPLIHGYSDAARSKNIATLRREGKPRAQAVAIAYKTQRDAQRKAGKPVTPYPKLTGTLSKGDASRMAKRSKSKRSHAITVHRSAPIIKTRRRRGGFHHSSGPGDKALLMICGTGFLLGYAESQGWNIPAIAQLGVEGTVAAGAYAAHKFGIVKSPIAREVAAGAGAIFFRDLGKSVGSKAAAKQPSSSGDEPYDAAYRVP
jgi:hypothetical protein